MPWSSRSSRGTSNKSENSVRLTGFFPTKRRGLAVGGIKADQLDGLVRLLKVALAEKKGLALFLWANNDEGPKFVLSADLAKDQEERGSSGSWGGRNESAGRRRIEPDDDPFGEAEPSNRGRKTAEDEGLPF